MSANVMEKEPLGEDTMRELSNVKSLVCEAAEDGVRSVNKIIRQSRYAAEDLIDEAKHTVKQRPFQAMGLMFVAGAVAGSLLAWIGFRRG